MAKIDLKFLDSTTEHDYIKTERYKCSVTDDVFICIEGVHSSDKFVIMLDKSTAIKFAKTLRTEINKIQ